MAGRPATTDAPAAMLTDHSLFVQMLKELQGVREEITSLGKLIAASPDAESLRMALERIRVLEEKNKNLEERLIKAEARLESSIAKYDARIEGFITKQEAKHEVLAEKVSTMNNTSAVAGVTTSATQHVARVVVGLIAAALIWLASRATDDRPPVYPPPAPAPAPARP